MGGDGERVWKGRLAVVDGGWRWVVVVVVVCARFVCVCVHVAMFLLRVSTTLLTME